MKEYICNACGVKFQGSDLIQDAECPECYTMDCQLAYEDLEHEDTDKPEE